ncbi:hypothetical protein PVAP13_9NG811377, partial [Panicum virgatum]
MNMWGKYGGLGCMVMTAILLILVASPVHSVRPHLLEVGAVRSHAYSLIRNTKRRHNATTLDETKVKLIFCVQMDCAPQLNFCCSNQKPAPLCYDMERECQVACPH